MTRKQIALLLVGALAVVGFALGTIGYNRSQSNAQQQLAKQNEDVFSRAHSPTYGAPDAKVRITEFFDPACETCRAFYPAVKQIVDQSQGRVQLVVRFVPFHDGADLAARILVAAHAQQLFIPVAEVVLSTQNIWASHAAPNPELLWGYLAKSGLNIEKARAAVQTKEVEAVIAMDMADAKTLNVTRTPGFFVNGKPLERFGYEQLVALVLREVERAYPQ
ncbi:DsbA family protein [Pseudorhodoferax sp.]|uniref:DsbA family protein n=1 Tax=Pseudorhodoferax sp. TaxID=1993553 RepID=UPI002DD66D21|nr:thioredoxin domain-containing protein [Pseudorhodoferax sp.]